MTRIVVDAMGGDFAPLQQVTGAVDAINQDKDLTVILTGDKPQIEEISFCCSKKGLQCAANDAILTSATNSGRGKTWASIVKSAGKAL